jgi:hypothetical protein
MYQKKYLKYNKKISLHGGANSSDPWTCARCNIINESNKSMCEVCTNPRVNEPIDPSRPQSLRLHGLSRSDSRKALSNGLLVAKEEGHSPIPGQYTTPTANPDEEEAQRKWEEENKEFLQKAKEEAELYKQQPSSAKRYQEAKKIETPKEELSPPSKEPTNSMCVIS